MKDETRIPSIARAPRTDSSPQFYVTLPVEVPIWASGNGSLYSSAYVRSELELLSEGEVYTLFRRTRGDRVRLDCLVHDLGYGTTSIERLGGVPDRALISLLAWSAVDRVIASGHRSDEHHVAREWERDRSSRFVGRRAIFTGKNRSLYEDIAAQCATLKRPIATVLHPSGYGATYGKKAGIARA